VKRVYLDHNATSPMRAEVRTLLDELRDLDLGNASSVHASGRRARGLLDEARQKTAAALRVHEEEVLFTSGGPKATTLRCSASWGVAGREAPS
jgi:cysteine desulfurase